ncbi:MAG: nucleotidyltransferase domain-containing protein, partial [Parvularculaceae bacterium]
CRRCGVKRLEVFGSAARGDDFDPERSDADFLVEFESISTTDPLGEFFKLASALSAALGRKVDLVEPVALRNKYVIRSINENRQLVYAA